MFHVMNCEKANKQLYLFTELTDHERDQVIQHMAGCMQCKELAESLEQMNDVIVRIRKVAAEPTDSFVLTNKIMSEVRTSDHKPFRLYETFLRFIESNQVRWTLVGVSMVLIFLFALEQTKSSETKRMYSVALPVSSNTTILNAKNFQTQLNRYREIKKADRKKDCKDSFKTSQLNVACLQEKVARFRNL